MLSLLFGYSYANFRKHCSFCSARFKGHLKSMALSPISMPVRTVASSLSMMAPSS